MLEKDAERKLALVALFNSTIQRRIKNLSNDIKCQAVDQIKTVSFGLFTIPNDGSRNITPWVQLMVFAKYVYNDTFKKDFFSACL